jgi:hypothetical protein
MRKIITTIIIAASVLTWNHSLAADWQYAAGNETTYYNIDFDSIATMNGYRRAWVKVNFTQEQKFSGYPVKSYQSQISLFYFDCKAKTFMSTQSILYSKFNALGDVVESQTIKFDPKGLDNAVPGSVAEALIKVTCGTPSSRAKLKAKNEAEALDFLKSFEAQSRKSESQGTGSGT